MNWTSTKTLDLLKDHVQIEAIEKCLEEDGELKEKQKVYFRDDDLNSEFGDRNLWAIKPIRKSTLGWKSSCPFACLLFTGNNSSV